MSETNIVNRIRITLALVAIACALAACGNSSSGTEGPGTGTVAILLTDLATDNVSAINFDVTEATLIGDQGQQTVYSGNTRVNLLELENFTQPIALGEVEAGTYKKLRLQIANFEIIDNDGVAHYPPPPAGGRIDVLEPRGVDVVPGRTLIAHVDWDAHKSIHVIQTGNLQYRVRPVVHARFMLDGLPNELVRIEGQVDGVDAETGDFRLCAIDNMDACVDVSLADGACVFDSNGIALETIDADTFAAGEPLVVIGTYMDVDGDGNPGIEAIVIEKGEAEQVKGIVTEAPDIDGLFLVIDRGGVNVTVKLQDACTKILGPDGEILTPAALQVGRGVEIEGVTSGDPDVLYAALIVLDSGESPEQLSGTIATPISDPEFVLATGTGDFNVCLNNDAVITVISVGTSSAGTFADVQEGRTAYAFGEFDMSDGCFDADDVVVDTGE